MASGIKETLRKIHTLSVEGGSEGEKLAAQTQLDRLLKKYGLVLSDVIDETKELFPFTYKNEREKDLLLQVVAKVLDTGNLSSYGRERNKRYFELTKAQNAEITFLFGEYREALENEMQIFFEAFIQKNRLFPTTKNSDDKELTLEEKQKLLRILQMAQGMSAVPLSRKRIEA